MLGVIAIGLLAAILGAVVYLRFERVGSAGLGMALLRTAGTTALVLLLINPARPVAMGNAPPTVLLDGSLSLGAAGGRWREARDSARALAGRNGTILRFGARVAPDDTLPPEDGRTRLGDALRLAQGRPGPVVVVTDGEIEDAGSLEPSLLAGTRVVLLSRTSAPDAAVLEVAAPEQLAPGDSLPVDLTIGTFGWLSARQGRLEVALDGRVVARRDLELPPAPGTARRRIAIGPKALTPGSHLLSIRVTAAGDVEPRDDERQRWIHVAAQPAIVVLAAPPDWEFRFLARELSDIAPGSVRGYALIQPGHWVEMRALAPVAAAIVEEAAAGANVVVRGGGGPLPSRAGRTRAQWRWLGADSSLAAIGGDWYVSGSVQPSPLAGRLGTAVWDSLPPVVGMVPVSPAEGQWVALSARLARRGAERPLLLGWDSAGVRLLTTAGDGLWRWALRGGTARETYRSMLAAGLDWLLGAGAKSGPAALTTSGAVPRGTPVAFRFRGDSVPDSVRVSVTDGSAARGVTLRFDAEHTALVWLPPGAYRWRAAGIQGAAGEFVVEAYSDEFPPRPATLGAEVGARRGALGLSYPRQRPWLFGLVVLALVAEWVWRHRRGLP